MPKECGRSDSAFPLTMPHDKRAIKGSPSGHGENWLEEVAPGIVDPRFGDDLWQAP